MGFTYTPDQQKVIDLHDRNILVSAAAGSGKTAVLVERIVEMVSNPDKKIDIDRLLIVTFTSAAASEMRERISEAITKRLEKTPKDEHLQRQATLIHNAQITTIDSFCLFVIRNHFNDIGLDPGFRVADLGELTLLQQEVLEQLLEDKFVENEEEFIHCVETYSTNGSEKTLEEYILKIHNFSRSYPWPEEWLDQCKEDYIAPSLEEQEKSQWMQFIIDYISKILEDAVQQGQEALLVCEQPDGPYMYAPLLEEEQNFIIKTGQETTFSGYEKAINQLEFKRLPSKKDESVDPAKREIVKNMRNQIKEIINHIKASFFYKNAQLIYDDLLASKPANITLIDLILDFSEKYSAKKREKNIVDFADIEHFALNIFLQKQDESYQPTKTAEAFGDYFEEILIDEYQDSNLVQEYLLASISKESKGKKNRFMVGDVKQSVYKFRLARPELFMEKYHNYSLEDGLEQRIDLHQNFRSRSEVIEAVNYICEQSMERSIGGINYDKEAALYLGADYEIFSQQQETELLLAIKPEEKKVDEELTTKELEATMIAQRIKELVGKFQVTDKRTKQARVATYADIVILLRSNTNWDEPFKKVLTAEGIPTHVVSKTGYFSAIEIQMILNYLKVLDNPYQDIPLCAVMVSPIIGFTEEELSMIKSYGRGNKEKLYSLLLRYMNTDNNEEDINDNGANQVELEDRRSKELQVKLQTFHQAILGYRNIIPFTPIHELMIRFIKELGLDYFISAMPAGEQRKANIDMLLEKAVQFEQTSYHGLFHFIRYMQKIEKYEVDFGEANILDENANTVRIMSIHKSKGLEFPICFVAGIGKRFNMMDTRKSLIIDMDYGIGVDYIDPYRRIKMPTLKKNAMVQKMKIDNIGEELRILYVALTRAKEKLIMTGVIDKPEKKIANLAGLLTSQKPALSFLTRWNCNSYLDFIMSSLVRHRCFETQLQNIGIEANTRNLMYGKEPEFSVKLIAAENLLQEKVMETIKESHLLEGLQNKRQSREVDKELANKIEERFSFTYPYEILSKLYTKTTVSELKRLHTHEPQEPSHELYPEETKARLVESMKEENQTTKKEIITYLPKFMGAVEEITGASRGNAYHKTMELLDFSNMPNWLETTKNKQLEIIIGQLEEMVRNGRLEERYQKAIEPTKISLFCQSNIAKRMMAAENNNTLYKEQPFVIGMKANKIDKTFPETETILVQGIIDVYFEEDGELVIVDYKTDKIKELKTLSERYQIQLDYYGEALEQLTGKKVKEKILYSFGLGQESKI